VKLPEFFRGMPQVARQEFVGNLKSVRLLIMALVSALMIVGGAFGFSALGSLVGGGALDPVEVWGHPVFASGGDHIAVVWVSDPYGAPNPGRSVEFSDRGVNGSVVVVGRADTNATGFARLDVGTRDSVTASVRIGTFEASTSVYFAPPSVNFTIASVQGDFYRHNRDDGLAIHVLDAAGNPAAATVRVNDTDVGSADGYGYLRFELPAGQSNVTVEVAGETETFPVMVVPGGGVLPFEFGPDLVLYLIASLSSIVISIFAIVLTFDAVSKERIQGTMDLLLSRPASRTGVLLGKFLGSFAAVALPITLVNLAGIGAITAASGKGPTGSFAAAFVGLSLLLIAYYVFIQLIFSTLAKTSGSAVLFGVLVWLLFNILYSVLTSLLGSVLFGSDPASYFRFTQVAGLGNPSSVFGMLVALAAPPDLMGGTGTALDPIVPGAAAVVWFVLLALALWTFRKKAVE